MKFNLDIIQDDNTEAGTKIASHHSVDIEWGGSSGTATKSGEKIAEASCYDDYHVHIEADHIRIECLLPGGEFGRWELRPATEAKFYLDLADEGYWLIRTHDGKRYTAGDNKSKVENLISRLNECHRPNIEQGAMHEISVCWNYHDKGEKCDYVREL